MIFRFVLELQLEPSRLRSPASCPSIIPMGRGTWNHPAKTTRDPSSFGWKWRSGNCGNINTAKIATVADLLNIITKASNLKYWPQRSIPGGSSGHHVCSSWNLKRPSWLFDTESFEPHPKQCTCLAQQLNSDLVCPKMIQINMKHHETHSCHLMSIPERSM